MIDYKTVQLLTTDLHVVLGCWHVSGVLEELGHVGHDGLLIRVPDINICPKTSSLRQSEHGPKQLTKSEFSVP